MDGRDVCLKISISISLPSDRWSSPPNLISGRGLASREKKAQHLEDFGVPEALIIKTFNISNQSESRLVKIFFIIFIGWRCTRDALFTRQTDKVAFYCKQINWIPASVLSVYWPVLLANKPEGGRKMGRFIFDLARLFNYQSYAGELLRELHLWIVIEKYDLHVSFSGCATRIYGISIILFF